MADPAPPDASDYRHGHMPSQEQVHTFKDVMGLIKWAGLAIACLLLFLTLWFCTPTGLLTTIVLTAILAAAGSGYLLTRKPPPEAPH